MVVVVNQYCGEPVIIVLKALPIEINLTHTALQNKSDNLVKANHIHH